ncbi:5-bromo-4-chloroindolyl phosphate hydrolysis protein [Tistlia consotensis]|uniref:5-bromo-4-chloroindolyl phosphate hydrolysis protein n=1 Tax=Tistlia consotensis USBA 355 TaxID=560819 RepID=A0A1Y6BRQ0_9PROT|nr:5-bromo-4-chloroindolyl phosphate hydrolysis family protein [Tistlia consotensis]SMF23541.1 5-bromo-4-chloroindolyl phosphate hydrolysis protein [Tistlia consotensis USBA 355]SNR61516.1 5-bromo-4-chloroindolyl phosphate hydrolysis protein [Tistlia consotensis]
MAIEPSGWIRNRTLVAGLGGGLVALLGLLLAPVWAALPAGLAGFLALRWHLSPRGLFGGIARSERPRVALVREVLGSAAHDLPALSAAGRRIADRRVAARIDGLVEGANELCRRLERRPQRLLAVQRLLTFYLPSALRLAESYAELEGRPGADPARLAETAAMLERLDTVFRDYAGRLHAPEGDALEAELRLLEQSLEDERAR